MPKRKAESWSDDQCNNTYHRVRSFRACGECCRRKRKCDGRNPCSSCAGYGYRCDGNPTALTLTQGDEHVNSSRVSPKIATADQPRERDRDREGETSDSWARVVTQTRCSRIISSHSAAALPCLLGYELEDPAPPRLHSYAWNLGLRAERRNEFVSQITSLISEEECCRLSSVYFTAVAPAFPFLQRDWYFEQVQSKWPSMHSEPGLEAVICGVVALGSFFAKPQMAHPLESRFVNQCVLILDMAHSEPVAHMSTEFLAGWILRTLYMRLTTRPYIACMASQMAMHVAEVLGFHRELTSKTINTTSDQLSVDHAGAETRCRYFWTAWSLNYILSTEYGLTPVRLRAVTCRLPATDEEPERGMAAPSTLVSAARVLRDGCEDAENKIPKGEIETYLDRLFIPEEEKDSPIAVFHADICLCLLRRVLCTPTHAPPLTKPSARSAVTILQKAFTSIRDLVNSQQPWWNLVSVPFQTVCVCLWFNSLPLLSLIPDALDLLRLLARTFNTHLICEALATAQRLVRSSQEQEDAKSQLRQVALGNEGRDFLQAEEKPVARGPDGANLPPFLDLGFDPLNDWLDLPF